MAATAIIAPVPAVDSSVVSWRERYTSDGALGMPPHLTLLYPFADDGVLGVNQISTLRTVLGEFQAFPVSCSSFGRFAASPVILYLEPDPATPFNEMTVAITRAFPDFPPFGGLHEVLVPHLTVAYADDPALLDQAEAEIGASLPLLATMTEAWVMACRQAAGWQVKERIALS